MVGAQIPARGWPVREQGLASVRTDRRSCSRENGFTMIELLVVLIIVAILMAIAIPTVRSASNGPEAPSVAIAGGIVWRAIQQQRLDDGGVFPGNTAIAGRAPQLVNAAGAARVRPWPETGRGKALNIRTSTATVPPTTGTAGSLVYSGNGASGWLAGYGPRGNIVFRRGVSTSAIPITPLG